ncbi:DUF2089 domain-containing protein [bacterium]|nr:DUF2089 domain-containing protein [bacterium]
MKRNLSKCPVCEGELIITRYECSNCSTKIEGSFQQTGFSELSDEQIEFIKVFLVSHGSIKEVERRLGISYPTVKNRLSEIVKALTGAELEKPQSYDVLEMIEQGDLSVEDALKILDKEK